MSDKTSEAAPDILLWDVMSTLVRDPFHEDMPRFFGCDLHELIAQLHPTAWVEFELDKLSEEQFLKSFFADRRSFDHEAFVRTVRDGYAFLDGIVPLLQSLNERGLPMHTFSNYPRWYAMIEEELQLSRYLQWSFVSCELGHRKPDLSAYTEVLRQLDIDGHRCVFIDDRESNCRAARQAGMRALRFQGVSSLLPHFEAWGWVP